MSENMVFSFNIAKDAARILWGTRTTTQDRTLWMLWMGWESSRKKDSPMTSQNLWRSDGEIEGWMEVVWLIFGPCQRSQSIEQVAKVQDVWRSGSLPDSQTRAVFKNVPWKQKPTKMSFTIPVPIFNEGILDPNFFHDLGLESNFVSWSLIEKKPTLSLGVSWIWFFVRQEKISNSRSFLLGMPLIGMYCASRGTSRLGCRMLHLWFVWYKWTNAYENARSRWWRPTWKTIVPWEGEISVERFFFVVFVFFWRRGKQGEKSRHFLKKYFVLLGGMLVSYHQGVRKVTIYYYLEDDTCQIQEPKMDNSGMPQGALWV